MGEIVNIPDEEFSKLQIVALARVRNVRAGRTTPRFGGQDLLRNNVRGACAQWCFAVAIGSDERPTANKSEIAGCRIRSVGWPGRPFRVMPQDERHRDKPIIFVERLQDRRYNVEGWAYARDIMDDDHKTHDDKVGHIWIARRDELRPIEDLPVYGRPVQGTIL